MAFKTCAVCGCPYVGTACPNCGSRETEMSTAGESPCENYIDTEETL